MAGKKKTGSKVFSNNANTRIFFFAWWITLYLFWILLTGINDISELLFGLFSAFIASTIQFLIQAKGLLFFSPKLFRIKKAFLEVPFKLIEDNYIILKALIIECFIHNRKIRGNFKNIQFDILDDSAYSEIKRAAYTYAVSLLPNTYVIGIDREKKSALIHELITHPDEEKLPL